MSIKANFVRHWNSDYQLRLTQKRISHTASDVADNCLFRACRDFLQSFGEYPDAVRLGRPADQVSDHLALVEDELSMLRPLYFGFAGDTPKTQASWRLFTSYLKWEIGRTRQALTFQPVHNRLPE